MIRPNSAAPMIEPRNAPTIPPQKRSGSQIVKCQIARPMITQASRPISASSRGGGCADGVRRGAVGPWRTSATPSFSASSGAGVTGSSGACVAGSSSTARLRQSLRSAVGVRARAIALARSARECWCQSGVSPAGASRAPPTRRRSCGPCARSGVRGGCRGFSASSRPRSRFICSNSAAETFSSCGRGQAAGRADPGRGRVDIAAVGVGGHVADLVDDPLAARAVAVLALLPVRQHRRGDEDR